MARRYLRNFSRVEIRDIATEYANSNLQNSHAWFEEKYEISEATFYNILNSAVIKGIVEESVAKQISKKAQENARIKAGKNAQRRVQKHYDMLFLKRRAFQLSDREKIKITIQYAESPLSKSEFARRKAITKKLLDRTLYVALTTRLVGDEIFYRIKRKALFINRNNPNAIEFWRKLEETRNNYQAE